MSVVVPTYRRPDRIAAAVASVRAQTWTDWELWIVDDNGAGTPGQIATAEALRAFAADPRVRYHALETNRGACAARNTGVRLATGAYVAFLDDDDAWHPEKLARQVRCFEESPPDTALVYGGFRRVYADGSSREVWPDGSGHRMPRLLRENAIGTTSLVMCRRDALLAVDGFDERLPSMQDFDLFLRLGLRFPFAYVDAILADHHRHAGPRISTDVERVVRAHELFMGKHAALFAAWPEAHRYRLRSYALELTRLGRTRDARGAYWRAWRLDPRDARSLLLAVAVWRPALDLLRAARRVWSRVRPSTAAAPAGGR